MQRRARERVDAILAAAAELLTEQPPSEVSTALIAERAGVPIGSLYQYFPNKTAVLAELARRVMAMVDAAIVREIEAGHGLPVGSGVDRAVQVTVDAFEQEPGYPALLRALRGTPEFREITEESNARVAAALAAHPRLATLGVPAERIGAIARTAIEAANALQDLALTAPSRAARDRYVAEMKTLLKSYLDAYTGDRD